MKSTTASIVGIDLGTSTSELAIFEFGRPTVVRNREGNPITPSAIFQQPNGELVVGEAAYSNAGAVREFKRKMHTDEKLQVGSRQLLPEECSALLLRYLIASFQEERQVEVDRAVITVPANWKDKPRRATMEAGRLAGIKVERLINEPTAAAMAFGARPEAEGKTIAVYDLGGGTFDVTILRIQNRVFDVVTSIGDDHLGGSDIDALLMQHVIEQIAVTQKYEHVLGRNPKADHILKLSCEQAKKELSAKTETVVKIPFWNPSGEAGRMVPVEVPISREAMETLIDPFVTRSLNYLDSALRRAKLPPSAIDDVVMVGGSTRIPIVRGRVAERMGKEPNTRDVNPDEAVALGAAIQAGIFDDSNVVGDDDFYIVLDTVNNDLGIETVSHINENLVQGVFSTIIPKDEKVPATRTEAYVTVSDNQDSIAVKCFQGNSRWTAQNRPIGEPVIVEDLPFRPAGGVKVNVTFALDASEILDVKIAIDDTGIVVHRQFDIGGEHNSPAQQEERRRTIDSMWQSSERAGKHRRLIELVEGKLRTALPDAIATAFRASLEKLKRAIIANDQEAADTADQELSDILLDLD